MIIIYNPELPKVWHVQITDNNVMRWDITHYDCRWMVKGTDIWYARNHIIKPEGYKVVGEIEIPTTNFDVVFLSYNEPNAEVNWQRLLTKVPNAKRVDGVKGILQAHQAAAKAASTYSFYVVDGDAWITDDFNFDFEVPVFEQQDVLRYVHLWNSENPVNGLKYGYGGVKLFNRQAVLDKTEWSTDFTTSFGLVMHDEVSNLTAFNTDAFQTWKSAFRECAKLASGTLYDDNSNEKLQAWLTKGADKPFGTYSLAGALAGEKYGKEHYNDLRKLRMINDFDWLKEQYYLHTQEYH
jgi:hypothetical protein